VSEGLPGASAGVNVGRFPVGARVSESLVLRWGLRWALACALVVGWSWWPSAARADGGMPGKPEEKDEKEEGDSPRPAVGVDGTQLGRTTWLDTRVDIPVSRRFTLFPQAALLRVGSSGNDPDTYSPFFGAGAAFDPDDTWHLELSGMYAPPSYDIESFWGAFGVEKDFGGDPDNDVRPAVEAELEATLKHVNWSDGLGPAGPDVTQSFLEAKALWRATSRLEITPRAMGFLYDKTLDQAIGNRLGSVMVLARVGTFAPRVLGGLRAGYAFVRWLLPYVEANYILYATDIGNATELLLGARVRFTHSITWRIAGGALLNSVSGPLVPPDSESTLPVVRTELDIEL
jgi:hypothetical protein